MCRACIIYVSTLYYKSTRHDACVPDEYNIIVTLGLEQNNARARVCIYSDVKCEHNDYRKRERRFHYGAPRIHDVSVYRII